MLFRSLQAAGEGVAPLDRAVEGNKSWETGQARAGINRRSCLLAFQSRSHCERCSRSTGNYSGKSPQFEAW